MKIDCKSDFAFRSADFCSLQEESELGVRSFVCGTESPECPLCHHSQGTCAPPAQVVLHKGTGGLCPFPPAPASSLCCRAQQHRGTSFPPHCCPHSAGGSSSFEVPAEAQQLRLSRAQLWPWHICRALHKQRCSQILPGHRTHSSARVCPRQPHFVCCTSCSRFHRGTLESSEQGKVSLQSILWQQTTRAPQRSPLSLARWIWVE